MNGRAFLIVSMLPQTGAELLAVNGALFGGGVVILLGGMGLWVISRRRKA